MLTADKKFTITGGKAPYVYQFSSNLPCVTFEKTTDTIYTKNISNRIYFTDVSCLSSSTVTLTVTDADGCSSSINFTVPNPCNSLTLNDISYTSPFSFSTSASSAKSVTFDWAYDTQLFSLESQVSSSYNSNLRLAIKPSVNSLPPSTTVTVVASDVYGCTQTKSYQVNFCVPVAADFTVNMYNVSGQLSSAYKVIPDPTGCTGAAFNWNSLSIDLPQDFTYTQASGDNAIIIKAPATKAAGTYTAQYSVKTTEGIKSTLGTIRIIVNPTKDTKTLFIPDEVFKLDCADVATDTFSINIEDRITVSEGAVIDWSSWALSTDPDPASSSITLTTNASGDHIIEYVIPDPIVNDAFSWSLCDTNGVCSDAVVYTVSKCANPPTANNDSLTAICDGVTNLNILSNDTGGGAAIDPTTVQITSAPASGTVTVKADGTVDYSPNSISVTSDSFKYKVKNLLGVLSGEATVTLTIICAGQDTSIDLCSS